jgi:hypothetical protein
MEALDRNKDVILNFGLIAVGPLREIEKLQKIIDEECKKTPRNLPNGFCQTP